MTRAFLIATGILWLGYGIYLLIAPQELAGMAGVVGSTPTGVVELRAMYGGLQSAVGALALLAGWSARWRFAGLGALLFIYAGLSAARLLGAVLTGTFSSYVVGAIAFESASAVIAFVLLRRDKPPTSR